MPISVAALTGIDSKQFSSKKIYLNQRKGMKITLCRGDIASKSPI